MHCLQSICGLSVLDHMDHACAMLIFDYVRTFSVESQLQSKRFRLLAQTEERVTAYEACGWSMVVNPQVAQLLVSMMLQCVLVN